MKKPLKDSKKNLKKQWTKIRMIKLDGLSKEEESLCGASQTHFEDY